MINTMRCLVVAATIAVLGPVTAQANPILQFSSGPIFSPGVNGNLTVGWSFTTNSAISVTALDAYLFGQSSTNVRLYDSSGDVLAQATVSSSDPLEGTLPSQVNSHTLTNSVALAAHTTYYIAENDASTAYFYTFVSGLTTDPSITYAGGVSAAGFGAKPTSDLYSFGEYFGPNFDIGVLAANSVPEPSSIVLLGAGLLGLSAYGRSRAKRRAAR